MTSSVTSSRLQEVHTVIYSSRIKELCAFLPLAQPTRVRACACKSLPVVGSEEHILQCMCGAVGSGDETEKKEDEVRHTKQLSQLFVDDLFPERHLLLCVSPKPVPANDILQNRNKLNVLLGGSQPKKMASITM